jgi:ribosomal protein S18 acetylase RimI-like enzyme
MSRGSSIPLPAPATAIRSRFRFEPWQGHFTHLAGAIIAGAYKGEMDSEINAQYRSPGGARRFLSNIVEFPGCGTFHPAASFLAFDGATGAAAGMVLSSFVAIGTGHISQLCVMPEARGAGLGKELLRTSAAALYEHGARRVSLTVTASNSTAISIYEKFGFRGVRTFFAYIWEA